MESQPSHWFGLEGEDGSRVQSTPWAGVAPLAIAGDTMCCAPAVVWLLLVMWSTVDFQKEAALAGLKRGAQPELVAGAYVCLPSQLQQAGP